MLRKASIGTASDLLELAFCSLGLAKTVSKRVCSDKFKRGFVLVAFLLRQKMLAVSAVADLKGKLLFVSTCLIHDLLHFGCRIA